MPKNYCPKCDGEIISYRKGMKCSECDWKVKKPKYRGTPPPMTGMKNEKENTQIERAIRLAEHNRNMKLSRIPIGNFPDVGFLKWMCDRAGFVFIPPYENEHVKMTMPTISLKPYEVLIFIDNEFKNTIYYPFLLIRTLQSFRNDPNYTILRKEEYLKAFCDDKKAEEFLWGIYRG